MEPTNASLTISAGDQPTDTRLAQHIHVPDKDDYYQVADDLPQKQH